MDNVGGGQRGLRATPSLELLQALSDYYGINYGNEVVDLGGSSNLNLLVGDADRRYVLRAYRPMSQKIGSRTSSSYAMSSLLMA